MIRVGVTGGIGSGKSLICKVFEILGVPVFYADEEARGLSDSDTEIRRLLTAIFGESIYLDNRLNRPRMAEFIFRDKSLLDQVNRIIHPRVSEHFSKWCLQWMDEPYVIHESAIIFESDSWRNFDRIIIVTAPEDLRLKRVISRPHMSVEKFRSILQNQLPENDLVKRADHRIINDEENLLVPQIIQLHKYFLSI